MAISMESTMPDRPGRPVAGMRLSSSCEIGRPRHQRLAEVELDGAIDPLGVADIDRLIEAVLLRQDLPRLLVVAALGADQRVDDGARQRLDEAEHRHAQHQQDGTSWAMRRSE
jgi:hypothetical protein